MSRIAHAGAAALWGPHKKRPAGCRFTQGMPQNATAPWSRTTGDIEVTDTATWYSITELAASLERTARRIHFEWLLPGHGDRKRLSTQDMTKRLHTWPPAPGNCHPGPSTSPLCAGEFYSNDTTSAAPTANMPRSRCAPYTCSDRQTRQFSIRRACSPGARSSEARGGARCLVVPSAAPTPDQEAGCSGHCDRLFLRSKDGPQWESNSVSLEKELHPAGSYGGSRSIWKTGRRYGCGYCQPSISVRTASACSSSVVPQDAAVGGGA
jgi:hypothetical protein